jgi:hypothetical protein
MKDFVHTGVWTPTSTTTQDPRLKIIEIDNGRTWTMNFYVGTNKIDCLNMEYLRGSKLDAKVLKLSVYNEEDIFLGSVEDRLRYALSDVLY